MKHTAQNIQLFSRVTFLDKLLFTKHLAVMVKSGITITDAVETLTKQTRSEKFRNILVAIGNDIKNGQPLAKTLGKHPTIFDQFYTSLIEVGEESGSLEENLDYLAKQLAKEYALRKKIQGALLYPAIVLVAVLIVGTGVSIYVLPQLKDLFSSLEVTLPLSTQILLFFADVMENYGTFIFIGCILFAILFRILIRLPSIKPYWDKTLLTMPIFGSLFQNEQLSSLCRNLGIMLKSGLPIKKALEVEQNATGNTVYKKYIRNILAAVEKGKTIEDELTSGEFSQISPIMTKMIGVGEKTGKLDETLLYLADFFEEEVDNIAKNLSVVLEPIILLGVGLVVGFVAIAIISPIYDLTGSIKK